MYSKAVGIYNRTLSRSVTVTVAMRGKSATVNGEVHMMQRWTQKSKVELFCHNVLQCVTVDAMARPRASSPCSGLAEPI